MRHSLGHSKRRLRMDQFLQDDQVSTSLSFSIFLFLCSSMVFSWLTFRILLPSKYLFFHNIIIVMVLLIKPFRLLICSL